MSRRRCPAMCSRCSSSAKTPPGSSTSIAGRRFVRATRSASSTAYSAIASAFTTVCRIATASRSFLICSDARFACCSTPRLSPQPSVPRREFVGARSGTRFTRTAVAIVSPKVAGLNPMCGIAGFISGGSAADQPSLSGIAGAMNGSLRHRGPDDDGVWIDGEAGVVLTHRRLSIVDLSSAGHQPMVSADGRYVMSYNGEVYSHEDMRPALTARGVQFRGYSDTEVILESIAAFGLKATLPQLI